MPVYVDSAQRVTTQGIAQLYEYASSDVVAGPDFHGRVRVVRYGRRVEPDELALLCGETVYEVDVDADAVHEEVLSREESSALSLGPARVVTGQDLDSGLMRANSQAVSLAGNAQAVVSWRATAPVLTAAPGFGLRATEALMTLQAQRSKVRIIPVADEEGPVPTEFTAGH